jgi:hypothetical protein
MHAHTHTHMHTHTHTHTHTHIHIHTHTHTHTCTHNHARTHAHHPCQPCIFPTNQPPQRQREIVRITCGSSAVDTLLGGGLAETKCITEMYGEFRWGAGHLWGYGLGIGQEFVPRMVWEMGEELRCSGQEWGGT